MFIKLTNYEIKPSAITCVAHYKVINLITSLHKKINPDYVPQYIIIENTPITPPRCAPLQAAASIIEGKIHSRKKNFAEKNENTAWIKNEWVFTINYRRQFYHETDILVTGSEKEENTNENKLKIINKKAFSSE